VRECPELPRIHALADGELTRREAVQARAHLAGCAQCRSELAFLMQLAIAVARGVAAARSIGRPS
jgi:anti-sigma factor RsiW